MQCRRAPEDAIRVVKLKNRFLIVMLVLTFIPVSLMAMLSFQISSNTITRNHVSSYSANLLAYSALLDVSLANVVRDARTILGDPGVQEVLGASAATSSDAGTFGIASIRKLDDVVTGVIVSSRVIQSVFLFDRASRGYYYSRTDVAGTVRSDGGPPDVESTSWYRRAVAADGREVFFGYDVLAPSANTGTFSCVKILKNIQTFRNIGILIINVSKSVFTDNIPRNALPADQGEYLILDPRTPENDLVFSSDSEASSSTRIEKLVPYRTRPGASVIRTDEYLVTRQLNTTTGWDLLHVVSRAALLRDVGRIGYGTLIISVLMIVVVSALFVFISNAVNRPLAKLEAVIADVAGGNRHITETFGDDEIGVIGNRFKEMVNTNLLLRERLIKADLRQREVELEALQQQMNPHFLYNVLDSIFWTAKKNKVERIAEMALSLSNLLKMTLNNGQQMTTVRHEMERIKSYVRIQELRFRNKLSFSMDVEESLYDCEIPNLTLQPFVENAITHGIEPKIGGGSVEITGRRDGGKAVFEIVDDGAGTEVDESVYGGFAISNVRERIRLHYGNDFGVEIQSAPAQGTRVRVTIPAIESRRERLDAGVAN